jgi:hypothetical protein
MTVTAYVTEASSDDLPPIPDTSIREKYFAAGRPGPGPTPREVHVGHYQYMTLDTRSGELRFRALPWDTGIDHKDPAKSFVGEDYVLMHWEVVPDLIHWVIDSGWSPLPYLTADQGNTLARSLVPLAQTLVDGLVPVTGTDDRRDWSRASISASLDIGFALQREPTPALGERPWLIEMAEAVERCPEMVKPHWADLTDERLEGEADALTRCAVSEHWHPQLIGLFGLEEDRYSAKVIGTRAWLAAHRAAAAAGRQPLDSDVWFSAPERIELAANLADATDEQLGKLADEAEGAARLDGFKLLGTLSFLKTRRGRQRYALVQGLEELGADYTAALGAYRNSRVRLFGRFAQIVGWQDASYANQSDLARRAGLPRQALERELKKLTEDADAEADAA